ncbi:hypothetical protein GCM10011414_23780 [Croceivirga lutea]|nr:hypothetical protein GCM10011414_23780 [Croceivirga lutea]
MRFKIVALVTFAVIKNKGYELKNEVYQVLLFNNGIGKSYMGLQ